MDHSFLFLITGEALPRLGAAVRKSANYSLRSTWCLTF
jgi:hypothetical protein